MKQLLINRNEILQGPAPECINVVRRFTGKKMCRYLDGYYQSLLIPFLAKKFKIEEDQIMLSYGLEGFFRSAFDVLNPKQEKVLTHNYHYSYYKKYLDFKGVSLHYFRLKKLDHSYIFDIDDCLKQYTVLKPRYLIITSPNNPTGNSINPEELRKILQNVSNSTLVILDEASFGFDADHKQDDFIKLLHEFTNLIILRSFSKLYALAGVRIAYCLCGKNAKKLLRYQSHYLGLNRISEEVAIAALQSNNYYKKISKIVIANRELLTRKINTTTYFHAFSSKGNFVLIEILPDALQLFKSFHEKEKIIVGKFIDETLYRVSIGTDKYYLSFIKMCNKIDTLIKKTKNTNKERLTRLK